MALRDIEGLAVKADVDGATGLAGLLFAYGGLSDEKHRRTGETKRYAITPKFAKPMRLELRLPTDGSEAAEMSLLSECGRKRNWCAVKDQAGREERVFDLESSNEWRVSVTWKSRRSATSQPAVPTSAAVRQSVSAVMLDAKLDAVNSSASFNDDVTPVFKNKYVFPRSPFRIDAPLSLRTLANEVVIGLMAVTLQRSRRLFPLPCSHGRGNRSVNGR